MIPTLLLCLLSAIVGYSFCGWTFCRRQHEEFATLRKGAMTEVSRIMSASQEGLRAAEVRTEAMTTVLAQVIAVDNGIRRVLAREAGLVPYAVHMSVDEHGEPWAEVTCVKVGKEGRVVN